MDSLRERLKKALTPSPTRSAPYVAMRDRMPESQSLGGSFFSPRMRSITGNVAMVAAGALMAPAVLVVNQAYQPADTAVAAMTVPEAREVFGDRGAEIVQYVKSRGLDVSWNRSRAVLGSAQQMFTDTVNPMELIAGTAKRQVQFGTGQSEFSEFETESAESGCHLVFRAAAGDDIRPDLAEYRTMDPVGFLEGQPARETKMAEVKAVIHSSIPLHEFAHCMEQTDEALHRQAHRLGLSTGLMGVPRQAYAANIRETYADTVMALSMIQNDQMREVRMLSNFRMAAAGRGDVVHLTTFSLDRLLEMRHNGELESMVVEEFRKPFDRLSLRDMADLAEVLIEKPQYLISPSRFSDIHKHFTENEFTSPIPSNTGFSVRRREALRALAPGWDDSSNTEVMR